MLPALFVAAAIAAPPPSGTVDLLTPGYQIREALPQNAGQGAWFAIQQDGDTWTATRTQLRLEAGHDPLDPSMDDAVHVQSHAANATFLVRGVPGMSNGPLAASAVSDTVVEPGAWLVLGADPHALTVLAGAGPDGLTDPGFVDRREPGLQLHLHRVPLADGRPVPPVSSQVLPGESSYAVLSWAGDLDGDDRTDLLIEHIDESGGGEMVLMLSTAAGPGQLVAPVAWMPLPGC